MINYISYSLPFVAELTTTDVSIMVESIKKDLEGEIIIV